MIIVPVSVMILLKMIIISITIVIPIPIPIPIIIRIFLEFEFETGPVQVRSGTVGQYQKVIWYRPVTLTVFSNFSVEDKIKIIRYSKNNIYTV